MSKLKIFSFFSGCGLLDLGFESSGYSIELVNEFSPVFIEAYKYSRNIMGIKSPKYGYDNIDVNEYLNSKSEKLQYYIKESRKDGSLVGFIGGPPCPDFSIAGKQRGKNGDNGKLSMSYIDLIIKHEPDFFLFENVKGLWRTKKHRAFYEELKDKLSNAGYFMTERLTNALEFGVPQDRDRIFLFGIRKKISNNLSNPFINFNWTKYAKYNLDDIKSMPWPSIDIFVENSRTECPENIPENITAEYWFRKNNVDRHPNGKECFTPRAGITKMASISEGDDSKKSYKRLHRWRYSPTVAYGNNEVHLHPYKIRRLTVAEALALQSLPVQFELPCNISLTDKFKTIGNGVPFLLAQGIAKAIYDFLTGGVSDAKDNCI